MRKVIEENETLIKIKDSNMRISESNVKNLEKNIEDFKQYGRRSSIRLSNVKIGRAYDCERKVVEILNNIVKIKINSDDIERCHPLGKSETDK